MVWKDDCGRGGETVVGVVVVAVRPGPDLNSPRSTGSWRSLIKVVTSPKLDSSFDRIARDSDKVVVGGDTISRTWRRSNEVEDGSIVVIFFSKGI